MVNSRFVVDVSPEMQLYKVLQRQPYDIGTALAEFVDNSVQSFVDNNQALKSIDGPDVMLKIRITIDSLNKRIYIQDNAAGINRSNFQRAIRMGNDKSFKSPQESLSVYGIGMKSSAIWFSNSWSIETSALGSTEKLNTTFDLNQLLDTDSTEIEVATDFEEANNHYTKIIINDCLRDLENQENYFKDTVLPYLQETFFKFSDVFVEIVYDDLMLQTTKAFLKTPTPLVYPLVNKAGDKISEEEKTWRRKLDFDHAGKKVRGFIMIMRTGGYHSPGIRLLRNRRVIKGTQGGNRQNKPEILLDTTNKFAAQRIYGEITLNGFSVNFMKTDFDENMDALYRAIRSQLIAHPPAVKDDFIQQAINFRKSKSTLSGKKPQTGNFENKPKTEDKIPFSPKINRMLAQLKNKKLHRLYSSLCRVSLINDPVLAYVGAWTLLECLANLLGKNSTTSFVSFYSGVINRIYTSKGTRGQIRTPIEDIHKKGNMNKHGSTYEAMNAQQLISDFQSIEDFLTHCTSEAVAKQT